MDKQLISPASETIIIRPATKDDISTMVALSYKKRRDYEMHQPQFWRYVEGAEGIQTKWFEELLAKDDHILLVAQLQDKIVGFIIGQIIRAPEVYNPGGLTLMIDDFCIESLSQWPSIGGALLMELKQRAKAKNATQTVVVCGAHDEPKRQFLKSMGLECASQWYVGGLE